MMMILIINKDTLYYSIIYTKNTNIIIGISFGSDKIKNKYNKYLQDNIKLKKLLILFKNYIDININKTLIYSLPRKMWTGGSLNKSYQLYMDDKNKYFIIYNKKNVYLNKKNTYKKGECLYIKINKNLDIKIKH